MDTYEIFDREWKHYEFPDMQSANRAIIDGLKPVSVTMKVASVEVTTNFATNTIQVKGKDGITQTIEQKFPEGALSDSPLIFETLNFNQHKLKIGGDEPVKEVSYCLGHKLKIYKDGKPYYVQNYVSVDKDGNYSIIAGKVVSVDG